LLAFQSNSSQLLRDSAIWALDQIYGDKRY
jgi:hypothetical protein